MNIEEFPFPHAILRQYWVRPGLAAAEAAGLLTEAAWSKWSNDHEQKWSLGFDQWPKHATHLRAIQDFMQSPEWIAKLEETFGIPNLSWSGMGGGLHAIIKGGKLGVHVDFNREHSGLYRRLNCLLYISGEPGRDGDLGLYANPPHPEPEVTVALEPGTLVVFETSDKSWHGHPEPYNPLYFVRYSVASYYFSPDPPPEYNSDHDTVFA